MSVYHYTTQQSLVKIEAAGHLRPSVAVPMPGERQALWFTTSQEWDDTANKMIAIESAGGLVNVPLTRELTHLLAGGLVRIECPDEIAPLSWVDYKAKSGIKPKMAKSLYDIAIRSGVKPSTWRVTFECVPREAWTAVEFWDGERWTLERPEIAQPPKDEVIAMLRRQLG